MPLFDLVQNICHGSTLTLQLFTLILAWAEDSPKLSCFEELFVVACRSSLVERTSCISASKLVELSVIKFHTHLESLSLPAFQLYGKHKASGGCRMHRSEASKLNFANELFWSVNTSKSLNLLLFSATMASPSWRFICKPSPKYIAPWKFYQSIKIQN